MDTIFLLYLCQLKLYTYFIFSENPTKFGILIAYIQQFEKSIISAASHLKSICFERENALYMYFHLIDFGWYALDTTMRN